MLKYLNTEWEAPRTDNGYVTLSRYVPSTRPRPRRTVRLANLPNFKEQQVEESDTITVTRTSASALQTLPDDREAMDLAISPEVKTLVEDLFARRPGMVDRVRFLSKELKQRFERDPVIESFQFEPGDPPITLSVYADLAEDVYWERYEAFLDFLAEHHLYSDENMGIHVFYDGPVEE